MNRSNCPCSHRYFPHWTASRYLITNPASEGVVDPFSHPFLIRWIILQFEKKTEGSQLDDQEQRAIKGSIYHADLGAVVMKWVAAPITGLKPTIAHHQ